MKSQVLFAALTSVVRALPAAYPRPDEDLTASYTSSATATPAVFTSTTSTTPTTTTDSTTTTGPTTISLAEDAVGTSAASSTVDSSVTESSPSTFSDTVVATTETSTDDPDARLKMFILTLEAILVPQLKLNNITIDSLRSFADDSETAQDLEEDQDELEKDVSSFISTATTATATTTALAKRDVDNFDASETTTAESAVPTGDLEEVETEAALQETPLDSVGLNYVLQAVLVPELVKFGFSVDSLQGFLDPEVSEEEVIEDVKQYYSGNSTSSLL